MKWFGKKDNTEDDIGELSGMEKVILHKLRQFKENSGYDPQVNFEQITLIYQSVGPINEFKNDKAKIDLFTGYGSYPEPGMPTQVEMGLDTALAETMMGIVDSIGARIGRFQKDTNIHFSIKENDDE